MRKPGIFKTIPFEAENLSGVEYLEHQGDEAPSLYKKGDIIPVTPWQKEHESNERYWKKWWKPVRFCVVTETGKVILHHEQIKELPFNILHNDGKCSIEWEENQCDGCRARIPFMEEGSRIHKKPNDRTDTFGIGCTADRYDRPKLTEGKATIYPA